MRALLLLLTLEAFFAFGQDLVVLNVEGMDLNADRVEYYPHLAGQLRFHKGKLYIRNHLDKKIFISNVTGQILDIIGEPGNGPGAFSSGLMAFGVNGSDTFVLSPKGAYHLFHFSGNQFINAFPVAFEAFCTASIDTNPLAVSDTHVIVPAHPRSGHLAIAYDRQGNATPFGELIFDRRDGELLQENRCLNEMLWVFKEKQLYGIMKYQPILFQYDSDFKLVGSVTLSNSRLSQLIEKNANRDPTRFSTLPGLFCELQIHQNILYVMASKTLFGIDLDKMAITETYSFRGVGDTFKGKDPTNRYHFYTFALADNGRDLYLGPARNLDADLIITQLPPKPATP